MEGITIGEIAVALAFIAAIIGSIGIISKTVKSAVSKAFSTEMKPTNDKIDELSKKIDNVDLNACKNFLVARLNEIDNGKPLDDIGEERFWEQYEHYTKMGGNSYIKHKVEQLKTEGKI